jgi:hypothetical protein
MPVIAAGMVACLLFGTYAAAKRRTSGRNTVSSSDPLSLEIEKTPALKGEIWIKATVRLGLAPMPKIPTMWWHVDIKARNDEGEFKRVLALDYDKMAFVHDFKHRDVRKLEDRQPMPPGQYEVYVSLRDNFVTTLEDSTVETSSGAVGSSIMLDVL